MGVVTRVCGRVLNRLPHKVRLVVVLGVWSGVFGGLLLGAGYLGLQVVDLPAPVATGGEGSGAAAPATVDDRWDHERDPDGPSRSSATVDGVTYDSRAIEWAVNRRTNRIRRDEGLDALTYSNYTASVARAHSEDMVDRGFEGHVNPDGEAPPDRFRNVDRRCPGGFGENYVFGSLLPGGFGRTMDPVSSNDDVARELVQWWLNSPSHHRNLLRERWDVGGVGVHISDLPEREGVVVYATQNFCAT